MARRTVRFLFDYISPYAYLAWTQVGPVLARQDADLELVPILFAALLDALGTKGPAEIPPKRLWVFKDTFRHAAQFGVPFAPPPAHPFNPLLALRLTAAPMAEPQRKALCDLLFKATWGGGPGVIDEAALSTLMKDAGFDAEQLLAAAKSDEVKAKVRSNTEAALQAGAFGVPSFLVGDELFWGLDSLGHLERHLAGQDPLTPADLERWRELPAASHRPKGR